MSNRLAYPFGLALKEACARHGRLCAGLDPHRAILEEWNLPWTIDGLRKFTDICVEAFAGRVALVKPQVAFYECFGSQGFAVLENALAELRHNGTLVVADAKRGDIGSTNKGYADAWLSERSLLACDALTVSPYLGVEALNPLFEAAENEGKGLFVLARTSNPEGDKLQCAQIIDSEAYGETQPLTVAQTIVNYVSIKNAGQHAKFGIGSFGVVVGATVAIPPNLDHLHGPVLLPGVGVQGGRAEDICRIVGSSGNLGIPNVSRSLLSAGPQINSLTTVLERFNRDYLD